MSCRSVFFPARIIAAALLTLAAACAGGPAAPAQTGQPASPEAAADPNAALPAKEITIEQCLVSLIEEAEVPAQEAGVLKSILKHEGDAVAAGELLAQIDDAKPKCELTVARAKLAVAQEKARDDINVRYSRASAAVAEADYQISAEACRKVPDSVPREVLREKLMKYTEATLSIEKARMEMRISGHEAEVGQAEVDAAAEGVSRHQIRSPQPGLVVKVHRHNGEWVQPGDPVLHVIRIDRLWVEGFASAKACRPAALRGRQVKITVTPAGGQEREFAGTVVFADPTIQAGGTFLVRAEVQNIEEAGKKGAWILSPGLPAKMTVSLR